MKYHNITKDDMLNGSGLRVVLWVSGCEHRCKGCQNMITWNPDDGLEFDAAAKEEIFRELKKDYISGLTLSGGDPLFMQNRECIGGLITEARKKFPEKNIWLYTGYTWESINTLEFIQYVDVIVDGKFIEEFKDNSLHWRGSSNQRVIDVKKTLERAETIILRGCEK